MITEALEFLADLVRSGEQAAEVPTESPRVKIFRKGLTTADVELPKPRRKHAAGTLAEVVRLATRFENERSGDTLDGARVVAWYGLDAVTLVLDDEGHRVDTVKLTLSPSGPFAKLVEIAAVKAKFDQKAFARLLRIDFADCLDPVVLLNRVKRVQFDTVGTRTGVVTRQQESLGTSITSKVEAEGGDLPEVVTLAVPVWANPDLHDRYPCRCSVEVDPAEGTFRLLPLPDELDRVRQLALDDLGRRLTEGLPAAVPAYQGTP